MSETDPVALPPPPPAAKKANSGLIVAALLIAAAAGIAGLVLTNFKNESVYARGVDQLLGEKDKWVGRSVRIEGILVKGSLKFQEKPCEYQFDATKGGQTLHIRYPSCIKPDTLRDDMPEVGVTAEGKLLATGDFQATNVLAKCPSKYEMKDKAKQGTPMPGPGPASLPQ
ncbi:MAG: cytochrome c maturation protein CcmE [Polyangiales bacterium]